MHGCASYSVTAACAAASAHLTSRVRGSCTRAWAGFQASSSERRCTERPRPCLCELAQQFLKADTKTCSSRVRGAHSCTQLPRFSQVSPVCASANHRCAISQHPRPCLVTAVFESFSVCIFLMTHNDKCIRTCPLPL